MLALLVLAAACAHEFAWQLFPVELQGDVRSVTQWGLICSACYVMHALARDRFMSAVCAAVALMSSTTAGCSVYWLATRFVTIPGQEQCSRTWGVPMMLISAAAAVAVFWRWPRGRHR